MLHNINWFNVLLKIRKHFPECLKSKIMNVKRKPMVLISFFLCIAVSTKWYLNLKQICRKQLPMLPYIQKWRSKLYHCMKKNMLRNYFKFTYHSSKSFLNVFKFILYCFKIFFPNRYTLIVRETLMSGSQNYSNTGNNFWGKYVGIYFPMSWNIRKKIHYYIIFV